MMVGTVKMGGLSKIKQKMTGKGDHDSNVKERTFYQKIEQTTKGLNS